MVAKITHPLSIHRAIYYNEHKVASKFAHILYAEGFIKDANKLNLFDKKERFDSLISLNKGVRRNTLHVSLSFAPGENLSQQKLIEIAKEYMQGIGFGGQPYLVYEHSDTFHPHIHIVTTNIKDDGTSIHMHKIAEKKSEPARQMIELKHQLVKAVENKRQEEQSTQALNVQKLKYSKVATKSGITRVLEDVVGKYKYRSFTEFNALLKLYNVRADNGEPGSRIRKHHGLVYYLIDENGKPEGKRIKASSIHFKPTLPRIIDSYQFNKNIFQRDARSIKTAIDWAFTSHPRNLADLQNELLKEGVAMVSYVNDKSFTYGLTFIDHRSKAVITGSDIGKNYSAKNIMESMGLDQYAQPLPSLEQLQNITGSSSLEKGIQASAESTFSSMPFYDPQDSQKTPDMLDDILSILMEEQARQQQLPYELRIIQKKKKNQHKPKF